MNTKNIIVTILITLIVGVLVIMSNISDTLYEKVYTYYQVYLNGHSIGLIEDENKLYELIDNNQSEIKNKYGVTTVYPPTDLKIVKTNTYFAKLDDVNTVYNRIEEEDDFAIRGYIINIVDENEKSFIHKYLLKKVIRK